FLGVGGIARGVGLQFAIYEHVFATGQIGGQTMCSLDVGNEFEFGNFEGAQVNLSHTFIGFVIDPKPMPVVAAIGLTQHGVMSVAPERTAGGQALVGLGT